MVLLISNQNKKQTKLKCIIFSVFAILLDSMSTNNFERQFPKTVEYLDGENQCILFQAHHRVAEDTFENVAAAFAGIK